MDGGGESVPAPDKAGIACGFVIAAGVQPCVDLELEVIRYCKLYLFNQNNNLIIFTYP